MKLATVFIAAALLTAGCSSEVSGQKTNKISPQTLCSAFDLKTAESLSNKNLKVDTVEKHTYSYATTCMLENESEYPYFTITLYYNKQNADTKYYAPPESQFNFSYKTVDNTLIAMDPDNNNDVVEIFKKGKNNWVLSVLLTSVKVPENSDKEKQLIHWIGSAMDQLQSAK